MNELFKLFGTISINGAQAEDELAKVNGSAESTGSKIQSIFQGIAQGVGMYLGQMAMNGVHQIGQFMSGVDDMSGVIKSFTTNMTLAGQSSAQIKQAQSAMESYAQATVYNTTDMLQTVGLLSTSGVKNATDLTMAMGNLASAAADPQQALKSLSLQITQVAGKGFIQTNDWRVMAEQASGATKLVQDSLEKLNGWSPAQFQAHLSDGSISADMLNQAIVDVGGASSATGQLLEKNAQTPKTFGQAWQTVAESIQQSLVNTMGSLQDKFIPMIVGISNVSGTASTMLGNAISGVIDWVTKLWGQLSNNGAIGWFQNAFLNVQVIISQVGVILGQFFDSISGGKSQKQVIDDIAVAFKNVGKFISDVTGSMADFFQWFILGGSDVDVFKAAVVAVVGALATYKVVTGTIQAIESARNAILAIQAGYELAQLVRTGMITTALGAQAAATLGASGAFKIFNAVLSMNYIGLVIAAITALVAGLAYFFTQTTLGKQIWSEFTKFMVSAFDDVKSFFSGLPDWFSGIWNSIVSKAKSIISDIVTEFNKIKPALEIIGSILGTLLLPKIISMGIQWGISATQAIASFAVTAASAVSNAALATAAWVVSAAKSFAGFLVQIPQVIAQFVVTSASAVANAAIATAAWVASSAQMAAQMVAKVATVIASYVMAGASALVTGAQMAAAWLMALGPIGAVIAIVGALAAGLAVFFTQTKTGQDIWQAFMDWLKVAWTSISSFFSQTWADITKFFNDAGNNIKNIWNGIVSWFQSVPSRITGFFGSIGGWFSNTFQNVANGMRNGFDSAVNYIAGIPGQIINFFAGIPGRISAMFSSIHVPSLHISGGFDLNPAHFSIPKISFYANGGIMTDPTMFGMNGDNPMVGGEAGPEAILPLNDKTYGGIAKGIFDELNTSGILEKLDQVLQAINNKDFNPQLVMDNGTLVGQIINDVDKKMGSRSDLRGRSIALWD